MSAAAPPGQDAGADANRAVEEQLKRMMEEEENHFKILLLGAGESGKSTVVKQVKVIYKGGVSKKEKEEYATAIRRNCIECMQTMIEAMKNNNIPFADPALTEVSEKFAALDTDATLTEPLSYDVEKYVPRPAIPLCRRTPLCCC